MPRPSIGSAANAATLLSALGRDVLLEDGTTIQGIFKTRHTVMYDGQSVALEIPSHVLHVPIISQGSLQDQQHVNIDSATYYVVSGYPTGDDWMIFQLRVRPYIPIAPSVAYGMGYGPGYG